MSAAFVTGESLLVHPTLDSPGPPFGFQELMQLYEANFSRLMHLAPDLDRIAQTACARVSGLPDLHLQVLERCAYTTTLLLTHAFGAGQQRLLVPNSTIRVYHDARMAEAFIRAPDEASLRSGPDRWERNRFLEHWLSDCLQRGYRFRGQGRSGGLQGPPLVLSGQ
jgi:uncharacterized protein